MCYHLVLPLATARVKESNVLVLVGSHDGGQRWVGADLVHLCVGGVVCREGTHRVHAYVVCTRVHTTRLGWSEVHIPVHVDAGRYINVDVSRCLGNVHLFTEAHFSTQCTHTRV